MGKKGRRYWTSEKIDKAYDGLKKELGRVPSFCEFQKRYGGAFNAILRGRYDPRIRKWSEYIRHRGDWSRQIKSSRAFAEFIQNEPTARLILEHFGGSDADVADILAVIYSDRISRDAALDLLQDPSLADYLGEFRKPILGIAELIDVGEKILPLDKGDVIREIIYRRAIEYGRQQLGPKPTRRQRKAFLEALQEQLNKLQVKNMGKKKDIERQARELKKAIYRDLIKYYDELFSLYEAGVKGIKPRVKNPELEGNNEYLSDFLSFYQVEGVKFLLDEKRVLIADEAGSGKTAQAIGGKLEIENRTGKRARTLVITPNSVKQHWYEKIHEYCEGKRVGKVVKLDSYEERALARLKGADFVIINYEIFGRNKKKVRERLQAERFDYVILDEVHNIKNPRAIRSGFIKEIADRAEYLCLLSGTPIPNTLSDTYMLIALLDKDAYVDVRDESGRVIKSAVDVVREKHWDQPDIIRALLRRKRLKREMRDIAGLPPIRHTVQKVQLSGRQRELYDNILENGELEGSYKLLQLRKAITVPALVDPDLITDDELRESLPDIEQSKYLALDKIISENAASGKKTVIFSPIFKKGVTRELEARYKDYGALRIDGDVSNRQREAIRKCFQRDQDKKVLVTTDVMGEGISLTAASTVVFLDDPYTPGEHTQCIARVYKRDQTKKVNVISLAAEGTVDDGVLELLEQKAEVIRFMEGKRPKQTKDPQKTRPIIKRLYTSQQRINRYTSRMAGKGFERILKALKRKDYKIAKDFAENYCLDWESSVSANTARVYAQVIKGIEQAAKLKDKVDLGSGPGILSHVLGETTTNVELNRYHFGQKLANPDNANIEAALHSLPLKDESFDLALCSLVLDQTSIEDNERERSIREANRILRQGSYYIITLPKGAINCEQEKRWREGLAQLGFEIVPELTGFVKAKEPEDVDFGIYLAVAKKVAAPRPGSLNERFFVLTVDDRTAGKKKKRVYSMRKKGICSSFAYINPVTNTEDDIAMRLQQYRR
jgi:superfamily II DNA or RNA helicase